MQAVTRNIQFYCSGLSQPRKTHIIFLRVSVYSIYIGLSVNNYPFSVIPLASSNYFWWLLHPSLRHLQCTELPSLPWYSQLLLFLPFTQWHNQQTSCGIVKWASCWYLCLLQYSLDPVKVMGTRVYLEITELTRFTQPLPILTSPSTKYFLGSNLFRPAHIL